MSLSAAMNSAVTGLAVTSRLADLASTNIANAATPGYVRRQADVTSIILGGQGAGVTLAGVRRDVSAFLLNERRGAQANVGDQETRASFLNRLETALGVGGDETLTASIAGFESALIAASSRPESESRLSDVLSAANRLVGHMAETSQTIQAARTEADGAIFAQVDQLNTALAQVEDLNHRIKAGNIAGRDTTALEDLRQRQIDSISGIIPMRQIARENGVISLYSTSGAALVDGRAAVFGFEATRAISAEMNVVDGPLSGLTMNGRAMNVGSNGLLAGGSLTAQFAVRDTLGPAAQARLDGVARDLVERFQGMDPSQAPGDAGLFTDLGAALDPADEVGLSARLRVNAAADPDQGGALWRLRDGLGAATQGPVGEATLLQELRAALVENRTPASTALPDGPRSLAALASDIVSITARDRVEAEDLAAFAQSRATTLEEQVQARGVDTDQELQNLLLIEQTYAANARVIQAIDDMLTTLMEL